MSRYTVTDDGPDSYIEFSEATVDDSLTTTRTDSFFSLHWASSLLWCFRFSRTMEAMVAECICQSLAAGLSEVESLRLASRVFRRRRLGLCLREAAFAIENGQCVHDALKQTKPRVSTNFLEAIRVGEERGQLGAELRAVARRLSPHVCRQLARWTGRSKQAIQFAGSLSRLLKDHRLTATAVDDAGKMAASGDKRFLAVMSSIVKGMNDGDSLAQSLHRFPRDFDPMFIQFVDIPSNRAAFRVNLNMLAGDQPG
jgi:type II secretory pathway component PulF